RNGRNLAMFVMVRSRDNIGRLLAIIPRQKPTARKNREAQRPDYFLHSRQLWPRFVCPQLLGRRRGPWGRSAQRGLSTAHFFSLLLSSHLKFLCKYNCMSEKPFAVVLLSGGLDSTTTLAIANSEGFDIYALSFDYGQRHRVELDAARQIA